MQSSCCQLSVMGGIVNALRGGAPSPLHQGALSASSEGSDGQSQAKGGAGSSAVLQPEASQGLQQVRARARKRAGSSPGAAATWGSEKHSSPGALQKRNTKDSLALFCFPVFLQFTASLLEGGTTCSYPLQASFLQPKKPRLLEKPQDPPTPQGLRRP